MLLSSSGGPSVHAWRRHPPGALMLVVWFSSGGTFGRNVGTVLDVGVDGKFRGGAMGSVETI